METKSWKPVIWVKRYTHESTKRCRSFVEIIGRAVLSTVPTGTQTQSFVPECGTNRNRFVKYWNLLLVECTHYPHKSIFQEVERQHFEVNFEIWWHSWLIPRDNSLQCSGIHSSISLHRTTRHWLGRWRCSKASKLIWTQVFTRASDTIVQFIINKFLNFLFCSFKTW